MGLRRFLQRLYVRIRENLGASKYRDGRYDDVVCTGYMADGGILEWTGRPWGMAWENFKEVLEKEAVYVELNMLGSFGGLTKLNISLERRPTLGAL